MAWLKENWQSFTPWVMFVVLYIATFKLAWKKLADLVVANATRRHGVFSWRFWWQFVEYRIILLAPYLPFLLFRKTLPTTVTKLIFWWVVLMLAMGTLRFLKADRLTKALWWVYGYMYDGLLNFYPYRNLINHVVDLMQVKDGEKILEVGCGTGNVMLATLEMAKVDVVGVDSSKSMIRQAKKKLQSFIKSDSAEVVYSDALDYMKSLPSASFDKISMVNFLYAAQDRIEIWQECLRLIKPEGVVVVTTSTEGGSRPIIQEHLRNASWLQLMSLRLFGVVIIDYFISELAKAGPFDFPSKEVLLSEVHQCGGKASKVSRVYGGSDNGVNVIFSVSYDSNAF
jgi:ubiquinone/menaquinone biosynthesis C-methylase UbiE